MTAVVPDLKHALGVKLPVTVGAVQLSVAVGIAHCVRPHVSALVIVIFVGQVVKRGLTVSVEQTVLKMMLK
jgi:hypothetical protein